MVTKEQWESFSDEEKSRIIQEFCKAIGLGPDFSYSKMRENAGKLNETYKKAGLIPVENPSNENPILVLKLIDPLMANMVFSWMFKKVELKALNGVRSEVPFLGYHLMEYVFDKSSLMEYDQSEKEILNEAVKILKRKGGING